MPTLDEIEADHTPTALNGRVASDGTEASCPAPFPEDVREYVTTHQLTEPLKATERLLHDAFPPGSRLSLQVESDPEAEEKWVVIDVIPQGGADAALAAYKDFVGRWVIAVPPEARNSIRVTFNLS